MSDGAHMNTDGNVRPKVNISIRSVRSHSGGSEMDNRVAMHIGGGSHNIVNADTADRLTTPRKIRLEGDVSGSGMFDGSDDVMIYTTIDGVMLTYRDALSNEEIDNIISATNRMIDP